MRKFLLTLVFMLPALAQAGPWCLVRDENVGCGYSEAERCYKAAQSNGGYCRLNDRGVGVSGDSEWCIVSASGRFCIYPFQTACVNAAKSSMEKACVPNTEKLITYASYQDLLGNYSSKGIADNKCDGDISCEARRAGASSNRE